MKQMDLSNDNISILYRKYLVPSICATMVTSVYVIADTVMVGHGIGPKALVALNLLLPLFSLLFGIGNMFGIGGGVLCSIAIGSDDKNKADTVFSTSIICVSFLSILVTILGNIYLKDICYLAGANSKTIDYAMEYGRILFIGAGAFLFCSCLQGFIRNDKDPNRAMMAVLAGSGINIILDYIFIYNLHMEMRGAILATVIGNIVNALIAFSHFLSKNNNLDFKLSYIDFFMLPKIIKTGLTTFLAELSSGVTTFVFNIQILSYLGNDGVVVYSVLTNSVIVCISLFNGATQAAQPIIAHNYGAGKKDRIKKSVNLSLTATLILAFLLLIYVNIFPDTLTEAFVKPNAEIYKLSRFAIHAYFLCLIPMAVNIFATTYLQATYRSGYSLTIAFLRGILLNVLLILVLPLFLPVWIIWFVAPIAETITMIASVFLIKKSDFT